MTHLVARLVLAMLLLPATGALFIMLFAVIIVPARGAPGIDRLMILWAIIYAFIGVYWIALWRGVVRWTRIRVSMTALSVPAALIAGATVTMLLASLMPMPHEAAFLVGGGVVPIIWVLATVVLWRETPQERMERISAAGAQMICCPICGYNMTGLREVRCPECGAKFTLDQLVAAQPGRDKNELRDE